MCTLQRTNDERTTYDVYRYFLFEWASFYIFLLENATFEIFAKDIPTIPKIKHIVTDIFEIYFLKDFSRSLVYILKPKIPDPGPEEKKFVTFYFR